MKICILIPSLDYAMQAGARIRYARIENELNKLGHELHLVTMQALAEPTHLTHDIYIISKCYDARAHMAARLLKNENKLVGLDLFDDYFSQQEDARLVRFRHWINTLLPTMDFLLCSTPTMQEVAAELFPGVQTHLMNDPGPMIEWGNVRAAIREKRLIAYDKKKLTICWFGIGDNVYFPVGLVDVASFGNTLTPLRGHGYDVELKILTNQRAMTPGSLSALRRLAIPYTIDEWTLEKEDKLLAESLACYLPVNAQNFSIVKSLNRAVTALTAGVQVISIGYPLYKSLSPFIYGDPENLLADIESDQLALREETLPDLEQLVNEMANPAAEAGKLVEFLCARQTKKVHHTSSLTTVQPLPVAIIHGKETSQDVQLFAKQTGALTIKSPFCTKELDFDIRFEFKNESQELEVYVSPWVVPLIKEGEGILLEESLVVDEIDYRQLAMNSVDLSVVILPEMNSSISYIASNALVLEKIQLVMQTLFPGIVCHHSEMTRMPWWISPLKPMDAHKN
jgi:hypothetical protein